MLKNSYYTLFLISQKSLAADLFTYYWFPIANFKRCPCRSSTAAEDQLVMATAGRAICRSLNLFKVGRLKGACQPLILARNSSFKYVSDTPPKEYGNVFRFDFLIMQNVKATNVKACTGYKISLQKCRQYTNS